MEDNNKINFGMNIALLIDAENVSTKYLPLIIDEANKYGKITYKRAYGDWTNKQLEAWRPLLIEYAVNPVQQFSYVTGKNTSDFTLVIDAMDILYKGKVDSFCIVSSDSDFTKLVVRLKEENKFVFGMGESKTPKSLVNSCETFAYLDKMLKVTKDETFEDVTEVEKKQSKKKVKTPKDQESSIPPLENVLHDLRTIVNDNAEEDGWSYWAIVAQLFQKKYPGFHPRNYGDNIKTLTFLRSQKSFEFEQRKSSTYVRCK
jgi:uncharacterized LabA/DUF88 family protein